MVFIGIDVGGTKIACGVTDEEGGILSRVSTGTLAHRPFAAVVRDMADAALEALAQSGHEIADVGAVGVGIPGVAENVNGTVIFCTNLGWENVPLRRELNRYIDKPVFIDNDATLAGLAESVAGVSRGAASSVFITLGTGVGGGIILNGRPWAGAQGAASELGHMTMCIDGVPCSCGKKGCLERYCSATALIRMGREAAAEHPDSLILTMAGGEPDNINGKIVVDAARQGDPAALSVFDRYTTYLALAVNNVVTFLDPEVIVLGGGVSQAGAFLADAVRAKVPGLLLFKALSFGRLELAVLGNEAGIIGAAMLGRLMREGETL